MTLSVLRQRFAASRARIRSSGSPEDGLVAVEYGLIAAAFGGVIVLLFLVGDDLTVLFNAIADSIAE